KKVFTPFRNTFAPLQMIIERDRWEESTWSFGPNPSFHTRGVELFRHIAVVKTTGMLVGENQSSNANQNSNRLHFKGPRFTLPRSLNGASRFSTRLFRDRLWMCHWRFYSANIHYSDAAMKGQVRPLPANKPSISFQVRIIGPE